MIGVDLGGTYVRAQKHPDGPIHQRTLTDDPVRDIVHVIERARPTKSIGLGVPALVDRDGLVHDATNIPTWGTVPLKRILEERFQLPVTIDNDANCFALGEAHLDPTSRTLVGLVMGTGLGAGVVLDGRLHSGRHCAAGEFGMIPYRDANFERYASGQFFGHRGAELAQQGDLSFHEFGYHVGTVLLTVLYAYAPDAVVLGGSVSRSYHLFQEAMHKRLEDYEFRSIVPVIRPSTHPNAGLLGAALLTQSG